jgi:Ca2+-binding EF-hand superfamily protein
MRKITFRKGLLIALYTVMGTIVSNAQSNRNMQERKDPPSIEVVFKHMDKNEDGKLSKKEVKGPLKDDFDKIDLDEDGFITKKELEKAPKPKGRKPSK